jgi:hypothetical protein
MKILFGIRECLSLQIDRVTDARNISRFGQQKRNLHRKTVTVIESPQIGRGKLVGDCQIRFLRRLDAARKEPFNQVSRLIGRLKALAPRRSGLLSDWVKSLPESLINSLARAEQADSETKRGASLT